MAPRSTGSTSCHHHEIRLTPSPHALAAGFRQPSDPQRKAALTRNGHIQGKTKSGLVQEHTKPSKFPAPLVLPGDELAFEPDDDDLQSVEQWLRLGSRNEITNARRKLYIVAPPEVAPEVAFLHDICEPSFANKTGRKVARIPQGPLFPKVEAIAEYLEAFYHGVPVEVLQEDNQFMAWEDEQTNSKRRKKTSSTQRPNYVGLKILDECVGIRVRPAPSDADIFTHQLNLNDLLDAASDLLPDDAYALCMIVHQDLYEDDDDDFCCGRAYGGSRIAVVSTARYNPITDRACGIDRGHAWPASHCEEYIQRLCKGESSGKGLKSKTATKRKREEGSIHAAVSAFQGLPDPCSLNHTNQQVEGIWLSRVVRTVSHELGHCFGMDHCGYYACVMQGTGSLAEDYRQPPYLCPVDLEKVLIATGADPIKRRDALSTYLHAQRRQEIHMFAAFAAWLD
ncbi:MAG: hypothetical protein M1831_004733 [Alyxoria varia]|nr:MAG: hypothetical protein M1831_004733 [Alyxoria varia]